MNLKASSREEMFGFCSTHLSVDISYEALEFVIRKKGEYGDMYSHLQSRILTVFSHFIWCLVASLVSCHARKLLQCQ